MKIDVESDLADGMQKTLDQVLARSENMLPYFKVKAQELDTLIQADVFGESTSPFGDAWKPLKPATVAKRRKGSSKPLIDTGTLRGSTFTQAGEGYIEFGVSGAGAVYAAAHQFGVKTVNNRDRPPARPFLPASGKKAKADFSRGPAKEWYDGMISGLRVWLAKGRKRG